MKKKGNVTTVLLIVIFIAGLSLLLYPTVSDFVNSRHQARAISTYKEKVSSISAEEYETCYQNAVRYNRTVLLRESQHTMTDVETNLYNTQLDLSGNGIMGYINIPSINAELAIFHGTSDSVLQVGIGHLEWTSLPVGGESSHCVLSGHRGLPSAKLFTDLDKLAEGDVFTLSVLDDVLTYEVDQILIVEPEDTEALQIVDGKDYCTLVTCTPYGINTHRMLVRGHRIENLKTAPTVHITADAVQIAPSIVAAATGIPLLILLMTAAFIISDTKNKHSRQIKEEE